MSFGAPLGLLALGALVPLFLAYFLRRRQKPRVVSALFLWRSPSHRAEAGPRFERFSREASLLLEIAAVMTAALFLSQLRCGHQPSRRHAVVVLDGSLSMRAAADGDEIAARAVREVGRVASEEGAEALTVVESGPRPKVLAGPEADTAKALAALSRWRPSQPSHDFGPALMLARELTSSKGQRVWLLTDGPPSGDVAWPPEVEVKSVGRAADNFAFLSAQRRDEGGVARVTLRVGSFAKERRAVTVVAAGGGAEQRESLDLAPGASSVVRFGLKTAGPIAASLPADALPLDSELVLPPCPAPEILVSLLPGLDPAAQVALRHFLEVAPGVRFSEEPQLTFGPPESAAHVTVGAGGKRRSFVGPFFADKSDPLLEDVKLSGVVWTAGDDPRGRPLLSMRDAVMLAVEDDGAVHLNVDLSRSNVQRTAAFPVLLSNIARDARWRRPGFPRKIVMLGEEAEVVTEARGRYELESPSGVKRPLHGAAAARLPVEEAGVWKMWKARELVDELYVLPLDARESDLGSRGDYTVHARASAGFVAASAEPARPRWVLGLLLLLLLADFWMTSPFSSKRPLAAPRREAP